MARGLGEGQELELIAMHYHHTETTGQIQKTLGVCGGEPCVRTTRRSVAGLVQWRRLGLSEKQLLRYHPDLTQADLDAAWDYYQCNTAAIDGAIKDDA